MVLDGYCYFPTMLGASAEDLYRGSSAGRGRSRAAQRARAAARVKPHTRTHLDCFRTCGNLLSPPLTRLRLLGGGRIDLSLAQSPAKTRTVGDVYDPLRPKDTSPPRVWLYPKDARCIG